MRSAYSTEMLENPFYAGRYILLARLAENCCTRAELGKYLVPGLIALVLVVGAACGGDAPAPTPTPSSLGPLALYESTEHPFSVQYPAEWTEHRLTGFPAVVMWRTGSEGEWFVIVEHSTVHGESLSAYVDAVIATDKQTDAQHEMVSREQTQTAQGLPAELLEYTISWSGVPMTVTALIYLHDNRIGFRTAYGVPSSRYGDMKDSIARLETRYGEPE